jgi:tRNA(Arg) A34 adenosine deaminase TadA
MNFQELLKTTTNRQSLDAFWDLGLLIKRRDDCGIRGINIAACLMDGNSRITAGWNQYKTHPGLLAYGAVYPYLHAETHCIFRLADIREAEGAVMYILRMTKANEIIGMCKPCEICQKAILGSKIKKVIYTTAEGIEEWDCTKTLE